MYSVNYSTQEIIRGSDFHSEQAAQNALDDYLRMSIIAMSREMDALNAGGYMPDYVNVTVISGGPYPDFLSAKNALVAVCESCFSEAIEACERANEKLSSAKVALELAKLARNPNESTTFESMGFAPHQPLTALDLG
jgi:hypothetical protein